MNHDPSSKTARLLPPDKTLSFFLLVFLELVATSLLLLAISPDPKNAWLLGFSFQRWCIALLVIAAAVSVLAVGIQYHQTRTLPNWLAVAYRSLEKGNFITLLSILLILTGWCAIFCPVYLLRNWALYYERLRPLGIAAGVIALEFQCFIHPGALRALLRSIPSQNRGFYLALTSGVLLLFGGIYISKIGLLKETGYWNVPGIPITGLQWFSLAAGGFLLMLLFLHPGKSTGQKVIAILLPGVIFVTAACVWGLTPMASHYFSLPKMPPNYQPFPFSDARDNDIGALSILNGSGINFHGYTDKPLYMVFLAFLHSLTGYDYSLLTWFQILCLSFIPVLFYWFGKKFINQWFGIFMAFLIILRQRNAIVLSTKIASVNPKLFVTEVITLLFLLIICYLAFNWFTAPKTWLALLTGGAIGAASLIRMNPFILFPILGITSLITLWNYPALRWKHLLVYTLGFCALVLPWFLTGLSPNGVPWAFVKISDVIQNRYPEMSATPAPQTLPTLTAGESVLQPSQAESMLSQAGIPTEAVSDAAQARTNPSHSIAGFADLFISHFLHNLSTAALTLPDSIQYDDLDHLSQRTYWVDGAEWDGTLPAGQLLILTINLSFFATGVGLSWKKHRWAGLLPLILFLGYDLSLAGAMNSGGRYIVPIDWVAYFYYGISLVSLLEWASTSITHREVGISAALNPQPAAPAHQRGPLAASIFLVCLAASLIPIADDLSPQWMRYSPAEGEVRHDEQTLPEGGKQGLQLLNGILLYPYYDEGKVFQFSILTGTSVNSYTLDTTRQRVKGKLWGGERVVVGVNPEAAPSGIEALYLQSGSSTKLLWKNPTAP